jgi:hypothetical protein
MEHQKLWIRWRRINDLSVLVPIDLVEVACFQRLRRRSTGCFMRGVCWIGWDSVVRTRVLLGPFDFKGTVSKLCWLLYHGACPHSVMLAKNDMEAKI